MLLLKRSSKTGVFKHLSNHVLRVRNFGNTKAVRVIFPEINEYDKGDLTQISMVLGSVYHVACGRVLLNGTFKAFA